MRDQSSVRRPRLRSILVLVSAVALSMLVGCAGLPGSGASRTLVGAWRSTVRFTSGVFATDQDLEFMYVFNPGGTMTESSNYDSSPPSPPGYGQWRVTGRGRFEARYTFFTTSAPQDLRSLATGGGWPPSGSGVLTEQILLADDGRSYDSKLTLELFDVTGKPVAGGGEAGVHATRMVF